jgi:hypothetical protein
MRANVPSWCAGPRRTGRIPNYCAPWATEAWDRCQHATNPGVLAHFTRPYPHRRLACLTVVDSWDELNNQDPPPAAFPMLPWAQQVQPEVPGDLASEWRATYSDLSTFFLLTCMVIGAIAVPFGTEHLIFPTKAFPRLADLFLTLAGLWFLMIDLGSMLLTAKTVRWSVAGDLTFASGHRELRVHAGDLLSVHSVARIDPHRLTPWRAKAANGAIYLWPRFSDMKQLWLVMQLHSPEADIDPV